MGVWPAPGHCRPFFFESPRPQSSPALWGNEGWSLREGSVENHRPEAACSWPNHLCAGCEGPSCRPLPSEVQTPLNETQSPSLPPALGTAGAEAGRLTEPPGRSCLSAPRPDISALGQPALCRLQALPQPACSGLLPACVRLRAMG